MSNPLKKWHNEYWMKVYKIIEDKELTKYTIVDFFKYSNLKIEYPEFCPLFKDNSTCHEKTSTDNFICLFCACPFFDFEYCNEVSKSFGLCTIKSKQGKRNEWGYWDCTECSFVHEKLWVEEHLFLMPEFIRNSLKFRKK
jgi:Zn-finger protein